MLTREYKNEWAAFNIEVAGGLPLDSEIAKSAAAMTRPRRCRQLRGPKRDRQIWHVLRRQRGQAQVPSRNPTRGHARAEGTGESRLLWADRPGHGLGLWLMRGTLVISAPRLSHWYGGLGR